MNRTHLSLDFSLGDGRPTFLGLTDSLMSEGKWVDFEVADNLLVKIDRVDAWWSTDLKGYYALLFWDLPKEIDREDIRERYGKENTIELAKEYGISTRTIRRIVNGK